MALSASLALADSGAVFVMTNSAQKNEVLMYSRAANGQLTPKGKLDTGGRGSGGVVDPLGSQGSLILSQDHEFLFAVNAGSSSVATFRVHDSDLELVDVAHTGGAAPVAVAQWGTLVYVLNFAGNSNVTGFNLSEDGRLSPIASSTAYLTAANSGASSLAFTPDGKFLVVTEKLTNNIDVFPVNANGTLGTVVTTKDPSAGLFEIAIAPEGAVLALEAGAGSLTSFLVEGNGSLTALGSPALTLGGASCWHAVSPNGKWVYTSNSGTNNISSFAITGAGLLTPIVPGAIVDQLPSGSTNLDFAISEDSKYLFSLNAGSGTIGVFGINANGTLTALAPVTAFAPKAGFNGIAAY